MSFEVMPTISIITATLNSEAFLEKTILSVIGQKHSCIEHIIIDGLSTDRTLEIVHQYRDKISKVISESDTGIYDAFNKGVKCSTGEIIYFLNSDDRLYDENVLYEVARLFQDLNVAFIYGNTVATDAHSEYLHIHGNKLSIEDLKRGERPPHQGFFVRRELFEKNGYFDLKYKVAADFDFQIKCFLSEADNSFYYDRIIAEFRLGGLSNNPKTAFLLKDESAKILKKHFDISVIKSSIDINGLFRSWLEKLLLQEKGITSALHTLGVKKVAIFGTMKTAMYLLKDLQLEQIETVCFLDNNHNMHNFIIGGIPVRLPDWLQHVEEDIDAIIISIEGSSDIRVRDQLNAIINTKANIRIFSWKDLVSK